MSTSSTLPGESGPLPRRALLSAGLAVTGGLVLASSAVAAGAPEKGKDEPDAPDAAIDVAKVRGQQRSLHLKLDNVEPCDTPVAERLVLTSSAEETLELTVVNQSNRALVGLNPHGADRSGDLLVKLSRDEQRTVYVFPHDFGRPGEVADHITVRRKDGKDDILGVDVWVEPTGGQWRYLTGPDKQKLDLNIVAVHAAVVRKPGTNRAHVLMFSPPRKRDDQGRLLENSQWSEADQGRVERWYWDVHDLENVESRVLELGPNVATAETSTKPAVNIFCCGQAHQADGTLLAVGGHLDRGTDCHAHNGSAVHVWDGKRWKHIGNLRPTDPTRWYPTVTALPDGRMLITTGAKDCYFDENFWRTVNNDYVVYDPKKPPTTTDDTKTPIIPTTQPRKLTNLEGWKADGQPAKPVDVCKLPPKKDPLDPNDTRESSYIAGLPATYPGVFVLPGGGDRTVIAVVESNRTWLYDYTPGHAEPLALQGTEPYRMKTKGTRSYPWYGSMVLLPFAPDDRKIGILAAGGQDENDTWRLTYRTPQYATKTAEIFEIDRTQPLARQTSGWQMLRMHRPRILCDATLLADGAVLISGGSEEGWTNQNRCPMNDAELFDPKERKFRLAAQADSDRRYHSVALLLPDGTVLKAGSTGGFDADYSHDEGHSRPHSYFRSRTDAEVYLPPYLWRGPRPQIQYDQNADSRKLHHGQEFTVLVKGPSMDQDAEVALIRLGAATHGNDMDQRYVWLKIRDQHHTGDTRDITAVVPNAAATPPGDYMLVVVDHRKVPSPAEIVTVRGA